MKPPLDKQIQDRKGLRHKIRVRNGFRPNRGAIAQSGHEWAADLTRPVDAWPQLSGHGRRAILALADGCK
jgi:hypothetical protein